MKTLHANILTCDHDYEKAGALSMVTVCGKCGKCKETGSPWTKRGPARSFGLREYDSIDASLLRKFIDE